MAPLLVVTVVNLVSVPLFLRYLGADMYALWFYVITFTGMFGFADLGLGVAVGRYIGVALGRGDQAAVREYWATGNLIAVPLVGLMAVAFSVLGAVFGPHWFDKVSPESIGLLRRCFVAGGFSLFFAYYAQFWNILSQAHLDFRFASLLRTGTTLFQVIPSIGIAWATRNPLWLILWNATSSMLQLTLFVWHARRRYGLGLGLTFARMARAREMAAYTAKTFAALLAGSFFVNVDRLILGRLALPEQFTHYTVCSNVGQRLQGLGGSVMAPVFHNTSRTAERSDSPAGKIYDEMFAFLFDWYWLAVAWAVVWHPVFMRLWLGEKTGGVTAPLFAPLMAAFTLMTLSSISSAQLGALNRLGVSLVFSGLAGLCAVAGVYLGWRAAGVLGAAYGFLLSRLVLVGQDFVAMRLVGARGWLNFRLWRGAAMQTLIASVFAVAYLVWPLNSRWLALPAGLHGVIVAAWLLREPIRRLFAESRVVMRSSDAPALKP